MAHGNRVTYLTVRENSLEELTDRLQTMYNDFGYSLVGDWKVVDGEYQAIVGFNEYVGQGNESLLTMS